MASDQSYKARVDLAVGQGRGTAAALAAHRKAERRRVRPGSEQRELGIQRVLDEAAPIRAELRSLMGGLLAHDLSERAETALRETSRRLQYEVKQLKKMQR